MRQFLALIFLAVATGPTAADTAPNDFLTAMMAEIAGSCDDLQTAPTAALEANAGSIANVLDNLAENQAVLFAKGSPVPRASILGQRYCIDRLLNTPGLTETLRDRIANDVAMVVNGRSTPPDRSLLGGDTRPAGAGDTTDSTAAGQCGGPEKASVADAATPQGTIDIRHFLPWPPAVPSAQLIEPLDSTPSGTTFDLYREEEQKLAAAGYSRQSQFLAPGGFAIVTGLERMEVDGRPSADRWSTGIAPVTNFSVASLLRSAFVREVGHFREIAVILTDDPKPFQDLPVTEQTMADWKKCGQPFIPSDKLAEPITKDHHLYYLIYEFESTRDKAKFVPDSEISAQDQLRAAGLLTD